MPQVMQDGVPDEDAENAGKGGCGLGGNLGVAICRADWHLHKGEHQVCTSADGIEATPKVRASFGGLPQMPLWVDGMVMIASTRAQLLRRPGCRAGLLCVDRRADSAGSLRPGSHAPAPGGIPGAGQEE